MKIKTLLFTVLYMLSMGGLAIAQPVFYVESSDYNGGSRLVDPDDDLAFQSAIGNAFTEFDFESLTNGVYYDSVTVGSTTVDFKGSGETETYEVASLNWEFGGAVSGTGTFTSKGLVAGTSYVTFEFSEAIRGFGTWVFNDSATDNTYSISAVETGGSSYSASSDLDAGNGTNFMVEGFIGVSSSVGLTSVTLTRIGSGASWEFDHMQVGTPISAVPEPSSYAFIGGFWALGLAITRRRRSS